MTTPTNGQSYRVKRAFFGHAIHYCCPQCSAALKSKLADAGQNDTCPNCERTFVVPGAAERQQIEDKRQARNAYKRQLREQRQAEAAAEAEERREAERRYNAGPVPEVLERFHEISEQSIGDVERSLTGTRWSDQKHLMYALRVSWCVPTLKTFKTLGSRWHIMQTGGRGHTGLIAAMGAMHSASVEAFLTRLYRDRFAELVREIATKAEQTSAARRSADAKVNALLKGCERIEKGGLDAIEIPDLDSIAQQWIEYLEQKVEELEAMEA